jgi:hypothetical protein
MVVNHLPNAREAGMAALSALGIEERNPAGYGAGSWLAAGLAQSR